MEIYLIPCYIRSRLGAISVLSINEVTLRRARSVLGWVTVCERVLGRPSRYVTSCSDQLSLAFPPWIGAMSTSENWGEQAHYTLALYRYIVLEGKLECQAN